MKPIIISQDLIKPASPTPNHLKSYEYSLLDQIAPSNYIPLLFYYPPPPLIEHHKQSIRTQHFKKSLSEILVPYYPLAGRLVNKNSCVDCNDEGVPFVEAFVHNQRLEDVLKNPHDEKEQRSLVHLTGETFSSNLLLHVQVTNFECGGTVVGISATHKILDMSSLITFLTDWATLGRDSNNSVPIQHNIVPLAQFIPRNNEIMQPSECTEAALTKEPCVRNTYEFSPSSIAQLKLKAAAGHHQKAPTRVEAVTSIIWKCLTENSERPSLLGHMVNLRKRVDPQMHAYHLGNMVWSLVVYKDKNEKNNLANMVASIRKGLVEFDDKYHLKRLKGHYEDLGTMVAEMLKDSTNYVSKKDVDFYVFNSWCGFPFYELDFGWGKPISFGTVSPKLGNIIRLIDTKDGGVEARITLSEGDMKMFEKNSVELLTYATLKATLPL